MDCNSVAESFSQYDSISSVASSGKLRQDAVQAAEEQPLLQLLQRAISETTEENLAFSREISSLLTGLNMDQQLLPNDVREGLQKLSVIMRNERVAELNDTTMRIVRERRRVEEKKRKREERKMALMHDDLIRRYTSFARKLEYLQDSVGSLEDAVKSAQQEEKESYCNQVLLSTKLREYQQTVEKLEKDLSDMEVGDLYPEKILDKYQTYLETSGELVELNQCLSKYSDLPPNLLQAKVLLEAKQREYESIEKAFLEKT